MRAGGDNTEKPYDTYRDYSLKCAERPTDNVQQSKGKSPTPIINSWWVRGNSALLPPSSISSLIIYYYVWAQFFYETISQFIQIQEAGKTE